MWAGFCTTTTTTTITSTTTTIPISATVPLTAWVTWIPGPTPCGQTDRSDTCVFQDIAVIKT